MSVIEVKNLTKIYQVFKKEPGFFNTFKSLFHRRLEQINAVNDISFNIEEGELVGFIGPNGAGKTTTLKCLSGLLYPTSGQINVCGFRPDERKVQFLKKIAFVMGQKNQLWWDLPPIETFKLNKEIYEISQVQYKETLGHLIDLLDIKDILNVPVKKLSLGQRMKCELVASLLHHPQVLFLDEPTIGLDVVMQSKLRQFIASYNKLTKSTIVLTSHYMGDVQALCKRIIIINHGQILYDGLLSTLVKKQAPYKLINLTLSQNTDKKQLKSLGQIKNWAYPYVTLRVSAKNANYAASQILANLPVADLTIQDADVEEVIREIFQPTK